MLPVQEILESIPAILEDIKGYRRAQSALLRASGPSGYPRASMGAVSACRLPLAAPALYEKLFCLQEKEAAARFALETVRTALSCLSPREGKVLFLRYVKVWAVQDIACHLALSERQVYRIFAAAHRRLYLHFCQSAEGRALLLHFASAIKPPALPKP